MVGHFSGIDYEMVLVAYWYQKEPHERFAIPPVQKRQPVERLGERRVVEWAQDRKGQTSRRKVELNAEMKKMKRQWENKRR